MSLRKNQFSQKLIQPAKPVVEKEKEVAPGYTIEDGDNTLSLSFDVSVYIKKNTLREDIPAIVQELRKKLLYKHNHVSISLFLNGLPCSDQIELQKALIKNYSDQFEPLRKSTTPNSSQTASENALTAPINELLTTSNHSLTTLTLHGWNIIGTAEEMQENLTKQKIRTQKNQLLRALGAALASNNSLTTLSLDYGDFSKEQLDTFFVNLDKLSIVTNTSTALKSISIIGSDIRPPQLKELIKTAKEHHIELNLTAPKKPALEEETPSRAPKVKQQTKRKNKKLAKQRPAHVPSQAEQDQKLINEHLKDLPSMENSPEIDDTDIITPAPVIEPPARSWLKLGLYLLAGLAGGIIFGVSAGGVVTGLSVLAELLVGNAPLVTIFGIGLSASGIGLALGVAIAAGIIIAAIAYGIYSAEKDHQSNVTNHSNTQPSDAPNISNAPSDKPASTHSLANTILQDPNPAASTTEPNDDASRSPNRKELKSVSSPTNVNGFYTQITHVNEQVIIMDEVIPSAAPGLGKKLDE